MPCFTYTRVSVLSSAVDEPSAHHCAEDKEEDGIDSCVDCWPHSVANAQCKSKKKKRKGKGLCHDQVGEQTVEFMTSEWNI